MIAAALLIGKDFVLFPPTTRFGGWLLKNQFPLLCTLLVAAGGLAACSWCRRSSKVVIAFLAVFFVTVGIMSWRARQNRQPRYNPFVALAQSCTQCGSTRMRPTAEDSWQVLYLASTYETCSHRWRNGISTALPKPVAIGQVVLVRIGNTYGAFRPLTDLQVADPENGFATEKGKYEWRCRGDGGGVLDDTHPGVMSGTTTGAAVSFGPFHVAWSSAGPAGVWLYYRRYPGEKIQNDDARICPTELKEFEGLDATATHWVYKASLSDTGVRTE